MTRLRRPVLAIALSALLLAGFVVPTSADEKDDVKRQQRENAQRLEDAQDDVQESTRAARDAKRAAAASTCETPEALADHIQRSINVNDARNVLGEIADEMRADDRPIPPKGAA